MGHRGVHELDQEPHRPLTGGKGMQAAPSNMPTLNSVPPRVQPGTVLEVPLEMFGISNLYLRVQVSISDAL